jgi:hypothetical protein
MAVRNKGQQSFSYSPNQDNPLQPIAYSTTTSNGAADGTTIVDADGPGNSGAAHTYAGRYWVRLLSGDLRDQWKRIVADNGSGTLTLEDNGFSAQVVSGVEYEIIKTSEPMVVCDAGCTTTSIVDDGSRDEADDYWNDYYLEAISGSLAGEIQKVTDFDSATYTFTCDAFSAGASQGDVFMVRKHLEANVTPSTEQEYIPRISPRVNFSKNDGLVGARSGNVALDVQVTASGSLAADTVKANASVVSGLMQAIGLTEFVGTTTKIDDVGVAGDADTLKIDTATHETIGRIGQAVMWAGNVGFITNKTDGVAGADTIEISPPMPDSPLDNNVIYASRMYYKDTDATQKSVTLYYERDGIRETYFDCNGNLEIVPSDTGDIIFRFTLRFSHYVREIADIQCNPSAAYTTAKILAAKDRFVYLDEVGIDVKGLSTTPGTTVAVIGTSGRYGVNGAQGFQTTDFAPGAVFTEMIDDSGDALSAEEAWGNRGAKDVAIIYGSHGNCIAIRMPSARLTAVPTPGEDENLMQAPYTLSAHDAGTFADPTSGTIKVPDWCLCIF